MGDPAYYESELLGEHSLPVHLGSSVCQQIFPHIRPNQLFSFSAETDFGLDRLGGHGGLS